MNAIRPILRAAGSLWFAGLLLLLLLVAMACATVFESLHGSEWALRTFYGAWWFQALITLLCINVAAAVLLRYPFSKRQVGFVVTHTAILVTLGGALLTQQLGVDGQVIVAEGQTVKFFDIPRDTLTIVGRRDGTTAAIDLGASAFRGFQAVDHPAAPVLELGQTRIRVERYLPDSVWSRRVIEDDDPALGSAVEVSLSSSGRENATWVFAGQPAGLTVLAGGEHLQFLAANPPQWAWSRSLTATRRMKFRWRTAPIGPRRSPRPAIAFASCNTCRTRSSAGTGG